MSAVSVPSARPAWRSVALPTEHGGWGLTLEPVLLGLLVAPSGAGLAMGCAAFLAFIARTPVKIVLVDRYRHRRLERTRTATVIAAVELALLAVMVTVAVVARRCDVDDPARAGRRALRRRAVVRRAQPESPPAPRAVRRGRHRRDRERDRGGRRRCLVARARAVDGPRRACAVASVTFAQGQVHRLRHGEWSTRTSDVAQLAGALIALAAAIVDFSVWSGSVCVLA